MISTACFSLISTVKHVQHVDAWECVIEVALCTGKRIITNIECLETIWSVSCVEI